MNLMINHEISGENDDQPREFWGTLWYSNIQIWLAASSTITHWLRCPLGDPCQGCQGADGVPRYRDVGLLPGAFHRGRAWCFFRCHSEAEEQIWTDVGDDGDVFSGWPVGAALTFANQTWLLSDLRVGYDVYSRIMFLTCILILGLILSVCVCVCPFQKLWPLWLFKLSVFGRSLWLCRVLYSYLPRCFWAVHADVWDCPR